MSHGWRRGAWAVPFFLFSSLTAARAQQVDIYAVSKGSISFTSEAPKELISARSEDLAGVVNIDKKTFSFRIPISSFRGFNSPLQQEHFNENYMESRQFPEAAFSGKIMESVSFTVPGTYTARAKGRLTVHGFSAERLIPVTIEVKDPQRCRVTADFTVPLADHNIKVPRVVYEKLASEIKVHVDATLEPRKP